MKQERVDKINYYLDIAEQSHREAPAAEEFTVR